MEEFDNISPIHYNISIEPDLDSWIFDARTEILLELEQPSKSITLHALDLKFDQITRYEDSDQIPLEYSTDLSNQTVKIELDKEMQGQVRLSILYKGEHNENLHGFYRGKHKNPEGEEKYCVVSQFQANDARRAFPCVDIPGKKATFNIEFLVENGLTAISNMPIVDEQEMDGKRLVKFDKTPVMSTYLLFFGVGDFEYIEKEVNGVRYRTIAHPPKATKHGQFSLDFGPKVVEYCEEFFGYDYPLPKLDQIATPAFAAGAMENWGAVLYRENALLHYDGITSKSEENGILGVIAHEIAHQWFGNLVSPKTWKWLWLNESFATFFANKVVDHYYPERNMWDFYVASTNLRRRSRSTSGVMDWDSMINTSPIELEGDGAISFTAKTVPILYSKGGSILRQVEAYLGEDGFKAGLQKYFETHAYGASQSEYLWTALAEATGKPVNKMMETWVLQEGLPLLTVERDGSNLTVAQSRFTYLPNESNNKWIVPITVKLFKDGELFEERVLELDEVKKTFELPDFDAYKFNSEMTGFYRTHYPEHDYEMLKSLVESKKITAIDRLVLEDELFALLKAKRVTLEQYLDFITAYENEDSHLSLLSIAVHLRDIYKLLEGNKKQEISQQAAQFLEKVFGNIGYEPRDDEPIGISIVRGSLLGIAVELESDEAKEFAMSQFKKIQQGEDISADLRAAVKAIGAEMTNDYDWFMEQFNNPESESEFISTILAMTNFNQKDLLEKVQEMVFSEIPNRNRGFAIASLCTNNVIADDMFEYYLANLDSFEGMNNFMYQGSILSVISTGIEKYDDMEEFFKDYAEKNENSSDAVDVGLEQLKIKLQLKEYLNN